MQLDGRAMVTRINHGEFTTYLRSAVNKAQGGQGVAIVCAWSHRIWFSLTIQKSIFVSVSGLFPVHFCCNGAYPAAGRYATCNEDRLVMRTVCISAISACCSYILVSIAGCGYGRLFFGLGGVRMIRRVVCVLG